MTEIRVGSTIQKIFITIKCCGIFFHKNFLGDLEQLVSPDPEVTCIERDEQDNYMMVACDGIYDVMSNEEIVEFINDRFTREENEGNICNNLLDLCLYKVSTVRCHQETLFFLASLRLSIPIQCLVISMTLEILEWILRGISFDPLMHTKW